MPDLTELSTEIRDFTTKANSTIDMLDTQHKETAARLLVIEQTLTAPNRGSGGGDSEDLGSKVIHSEEFKSFLGSNRKTSGQITVGSFHTKSNLINATGLNQPLVPPYIRPGIIRPGEQPLTIRDLLPSTPISSNMVEFTKETSHTNNAAMQTAEAQLKAESALGFQLSYSPVQTLAHFIPVSRQLLDDAPAIQGYVNSRMIFFLKLVEDQQLLSGDGTGTNLSGLITNATTFDETVVTPAVDTFIDVLALAVLQCSKSFLPPDGIVLSPLDWARIQRIKTTGTASSGQYIFADPHSVAPPRLWGLPVVQSWSMPESQFLVGAFAMAAMIWDRNNATVEISREHADFFVRNMAALLVEERLALTVFRSDALVYGGFPFGS
jgi:HK97 family phage major capsid protein